MLITDTIASFAVQMPHKISIVFDKKCVSYVELNSLINQTANALLSTGTCSNSGEQNIVAILLDNSIELIQVFLAASKIGWIAAVLDPKWSSNHLDASINDCQPNVLVTDWLNYQRLHMIPDETKVIVVSNTEESTSNHNEITFNDWIRHASPNEPRMSVSERDLFYMGYTSGTTGKPKGFIRSHESWIESFDVSSSMFDLNPSNHVLAPGPLVHSLSIYAAAHTLFMGGTFYFVRKFDANSILDLLSSYPISHLYLVPTMFEGVFKAGILQSKSFRAPVVKGIISSGDKWTPESKQKAGIIFPNARLFEFYGASELSFITVLDPEGNKRKPDSVGRPVKNLKISIRDADGNEVKTGEVGQLFVQSKMVFAGYYHNPEETSQVLQNGWATVGDLVRQDEEGFVYIVGRKKNMIISGGLNIYPEEVERLLLKLPEIDEVAIVGIPDSYWGQRVVALIKCKSNRTLEDYEIKSYCRENLASFKCPKEIIRVDSFPYTTSGKISRKEIYEQMLARMCHQ